MQRTFLKDLAEAAGVSVSQASRALNGKAEVAPEVRQRIHELARKMNYRNLSHQHTVTLAVLISWMDHFTASLFNALSREAERNGIRLAVISPQHLSMLDEWLFDGVILISGRILIPDWHERCRLPLVAVNSRGNLLDRIPGVFSDGGFSQAMEYLISRGHRRIAVVNPGADIPNPGWEERRKGVPERRRKVGARRRGALSLLPGVAGSRSVALPAARRTLYRIPRCIVRQTGRRLLDFLRTGANRFRLMFR